jgi:hypothetical protein
MGSEHGESTAGKREFVSVAEESMQFERDVQALAARLEASGDNSGAKLVRRLQSRLEHTQSWYGARFKRLFEWAHGELNESLRNRYFSIVANGTADVFEPPTYAQELNIARYRAERAEADLAALSAKF